MILALEPEFTILTSLGKMYIVDGFSKSTNTVYEYLGNFWHGNPEEYGLDDINPINNKTFGELYQRTIQKIMDLEAEGYKVVFEWGP